jgi:hypothetical protein
MTRSSMNMIEYAAIDLLITEAGVRPEDVAEILIDGMGVVFTLFVRVPTDDGSIGAILMHNEDLMVTKRRYEIHRPGSHVHEADVVSDHTHE